MPRVFESIFIEVDTPKLKAIVGEIYRVPNTNEPNAINMYETTIKQLQHYQHNIIIGTDQNFDYIKIDQHKNTEDLLNTFITNGLIPTITKPTRITHTSSTLIDNIYISINNKVHIKSGILCEYISDHFPIIACVGSTKREKRPKPLRITKRQLNETSIQLIGDKIRNTNWNCLSYTDINDSYTKFSDTLSSIIDSVAPEKTTTIPASRVIRNPWMTKGLITSSRTLNRLHKKQLGQDKSHTSYIKFYKYRNLYNQLKRKTKDTFYQDLLHEYRHNIRKTWGVINTLIGRSNDKTSISETFKINNQYINNQELIANEFCSFFTNIGMKYASEIPESKHSHFHYMSGKQPNSMIMNLTDADEILTVINSLKSKKSSGYDQISSSFIKEIKN